MLNKIACNSKDVTVAMFNPSTSFVQSKCVTVVIQTLHKHIAVETGESLHALAAVELIAVQDTGPSVRTRTRGTRSCKHSQQFISSSVQTLITLITLSLNL